MKRAILGILKALLPLVIVAAALVAAVTMIMNRPPVEILTPVIEPPGVRVHEVTLSDAPLSVTSQGTVRPRTESQLVPEIAGRVTWVAPSFAEGGFFEAGDVLVKIDPFDYEQALVSARSQLAQARLRLAEEEAEAEVAQREWETLGRGDPRELALRKPQLEDARASVAAAEAGVERATRDLQRAEIVAPYAGRVRTKNVDIGQYVRVGDALATVYAVDVAEIRLPLPDDELAYLDLPLSYRGVEQQAQPGVTLRATFAGETHVWNGRIVRTESEIDSVSRMVHAVAEVEDPYAPGPNPNRPPLAVGMYVEAEISGRTVRDVAVLPRQALRGRDQVLVVTPDDRLSFRAVDVLRTSTESVILRAGLQANELVVISPLDTPTDGMRVQLADADPDLLARRAAAAGGRTTPADEATAAEQAPASTTAGADPAPFDTLAAAAPESLSTETAAGQGSPTAATRAAPVETAAAPPAPAATVPVGRPAYREAAPETPAASGTEERPAWLLSLLEEDPPSRSGAPSRRASTTPAPVTAGSQARLTTEIRRPRARDRGGPEPGPGPARPAIRELSAGAAPAPSAPAPEVEPARRPVVPIDAVARPATASTPAVAPPAASAMVAVEFANLNQGTGDPGFGPALSRAVATRLATAEGITVVDASDARYVVRGGVQQVGPLVRITARIVDTEDGAVLHAAKVDGISADRPALEANVAAVVIEHLSGSLSSTDPVPAASGAVPAGTMRNALAVLPFDVLSAGAAPDLAVDLGTAITQAVAEQMATLREVAIVTPGAEAAWAIGGGIQRIGSMVRVTARLTDVRNGTVVTAVKVDGTVEQLADLQARVAAVMIESVRDALAGASLARVDPGMHALPRTEGRRS